MSNMPMTKRFTLATMIAAVVLGIAGLIGSANAAPGGVPGPPDGGGGDGAAPDFGDLIILYRDADGVPWPSEAVPVPDPETGELVDGGLCWQPIAFNVDDEILCPPECVVDSDPSGTDVVAVNQYNCAVEDGCSGCTQETDFGRLNAARSPDEVFNRQLEDVIVNLATADCVTLDPAGRLVATRVGDDLSVLVSTIDSPLQNLAIYRQLILTGTIGAPLPAGAGGTLDTAARGMGAGSDKTGEVNVDLVAYLNQIMGLTDPGTATILDPKICETYREEVQGVIQLVEKCFLDYGAYDYTRTTNFGALPSPAYIPETAPEDGVFEYLTLVSDPPPLFGIVQGPITTAVFNDDEAMDGNIGGFAQAADDARAVISYMHSWQVPVDYETEVACEASGDIAHDVSISDVSGLQVPKNIVDGSSDREFIVTVANAGPDDATVTLTVTAVPDAEGTVLANLDGDDPDAGFIPSPFVFEPIVIAPGTSETFTALISVDIGERTTINWTAVAAAGPGTDPNPGNNTATAVSNVKVTGGGGGGGPP